MTATLNGTHGNGTTSYDRDGGDGPAYMRVPAGRQGMRAATKAKVDVYGWTVVDTPGEFQLIPKTDLVVDHAYQRETVNAKRVNRIAAAFSWLKFGVLMVVRRPDGKWCVVDGQHRKLAADKRADLGVLPCLVFGVQKIEDEADAFLAVNADRGAVQVRDKWRTLLAAGDADATRVLQMVESSGYEIKNSSSGRTVYCISLLLRVMGVSPDACRTAWEAAVKVAAGGVVTDNLLGPLFWTQMHLGRTAQPDLTHRATLAPLVKAGAEGVVDEVRKSCGYHGSRRPNVLAEGVIKTINKSRRPRNHLRLPGQVADETATD